MIQEKTVFILGAGASLHAGFPTGAELTEIVLDAIEKLNTNLFHILPPNPSRLESLKLHGDTIRKFQLFLGESKIHIPHVKEFADQLKHSQLYSVDAFLERRPEYTKVGKICMAFIIGNRETHANVYENPNWYRHLVNKINTHFETFGENKIAFLTYNYDRSLEYYLFRSLVSISGKSIEQCIEKLSQIPIIHLHGKLGELDFNAPEKNYYYGLEHKTNEAIKKDSDSINIIHDDLSKNEDFRKAHNILYDAKKIIFLGFGYNQINIDRLNLKNIGQNIVTGSTIGLRPKEIEEIVLKNHNFRLEFNHFQTCEEYLKNSITLR